MLIIIDQKISASANEILSSYGDLLELKTEGITYPAISGHPDIFFCQAGDKLIIAPNLPEQYFEQLNKKGIDYITGEFSVGAEYPASARYNAVATSNYLIHNFRHTDFMITRTLEDLNPIHVDQGYCRCNLLPLKDDHFITSDAGIFKFLKGLHPLGLHPLGLHPSGLHPLGLHPSGLHPSGLQPSGLHPSGLHPEGHNLLVSPEGILLEGFPHGFFGGCCGVWEEKVFVNGSLKMFPEEDKVRKYLGKLGYEIIELSNGPLIDVGSLFFCLPTTPKNHFPLPTND